MIASIVKRSVACVLLVVLASPLYAGFDEVAQAIDSHPGVERAGIPFMSLLRVVAWIVSPKGVHDFQIATFDGAQRIDGNSMQRLIQQNAGRGFTPLVQSRSSKSGEWNFIYAKAKSDSDRMELIIVSHDRSDTVLIRCDVDAGLMAEHLEYAPRDVTKIAHK